jgi:D-alanyl-lipoteichoic acid acyltransferase DltB (MBOAT superfamily)
VVFNSFQYAVFLPVVLVVYWRLGHRGQNLFLLIASYVFYAFWDPRFLILMAISTVTDYTVGRRLAISDDERRRKLLFLASLAVNLGILGFFKYYNFFIGSAARMLTRVGLQPHVPVLRVLLPVGISFYTFHGISYAFDVYRRHIDAERNPITFAVFVAYFPQLVAGPIGRAHIQLPQFARARQRPTWQEVRSGLFLILLGLFKKVVIADALAPYVNRAFASSLTSGWVDLLIGVYAFAFEIYGDFAGYSDIARGSSRLLGIELPLNFDQPYLSRSITEFWRRWHISLSTWLRDYLYIPLGGNRGSSLATYRNLIVTMLLGGLWHGAAWTFVIWGAYHGTLLATERAVGIDGVRPGRLAARDLPRVIVTFHLVCVGWVLFRAPNLSVTGHILQGIVSLRSGPISFDAISVLVPVAALAVFIDLAQRQANDHVAMLTWPVLSRAGVFAVFIGAIVVFSGGTPVPFIYFQF